MIGMGRYRYIFIISVLTAGIAFLSRCVSPSSANTADLRGDRYAGSETCRQCHASIYESFAQTAHANTTAALPMQAARKAIASGNNSYAYPNTDVVRMEMQNETYHQSLYHEGQKILSHSFDLTVGSGRKAQTYLYYNEARQLAQLPVSFLVQKESWVNSPGFPAESPKFDRIVPSNCLGCHSSYVGVKQSYEGVVLHEEFQKGAVIYGIDCERCHGGAAKHVNWHQEHPTEKKGQFLASVNSLSRDQKLDGCALCHSGVKDVERSLFLYQPGEKLSDYYAPEFGRQDTAKMDVHGNQSQLLMASACYRMSADLNCNSCHSVHVKERDRLETFSARCLNCHKGVQHSTLKVSQEQLQYNCIDCHMPLKPSGIISLLEEKKERAEPDFIRTHLVTIYPKETAAFLKNLKGSKQ